MRSRKINITAQMLLIIAALTIAPSLSSAESDPYASQIQSRMQQTNAADKSSGKLAAAKDEKGHSQAQSGKSDMKKLSEKHSGVNEPVHPNHHKKKPKHHHDHS